MKAVHLKVLLLELGAGAFLRFFNLLSFHAFDFDESVYAQAALALARGYIPYKDAFFAHPPVYLFMEFLVTLISPSLLAIRSFNVLLGVGTALLVFFTARLRYSERTALIASGIYAFYPMAIYSNKTALVDNGLSFFIVLTLFLFFKYLKENELKFLALSGLFAGVSFMTKYTALLLIGTLVLFSSLTFFKKKFRHLLIFVVSAVIFPAAVFFILLFIGAWPYMFAQTVQWNVIRFGMPAIEKFWFFAQLILSVSPLLLAVLIAMPRNIGDRTWQLLAAWSFIPIAVLSLSKVVFLQYVFSLIPGMCILVAKGLDSIVPEDFSFSSAPRLMNFRLLKKNMVAVVDIGLAFMFILATFWYAPAFHYGAQWFMVDSILGNESSAIMIQRQMELANLVKALTEPSDKIWVTDASVGFLSERMIVEPESEFWRFQGFFQDVWGYSWTRSDYRGPIPGYSEGLITLNNIRAAWQAEKPKVILFFESSLVDQFIWDGITNAYTKQEGLAGYVIANYQLVRASQFPNVEIWISNT